MRKILLALIALIGISSYVEAGISEGYAGSFADNKIWFSSYTCSNDVNAVISTGNMIIGYVQILSTGDGSQIQFQSFQSTNANYGFPKFFSSAPLTFPIDTFNPNILNPNGVYCMFKSTTGFVYTTSGTMPAKLRILWDYLISR